MDAAMPRRKRVWRRWRKRGQGLVEYALILVAIAIVVLAILTFIGQVVSTNMYSRISSGFPSP